MFKTLALLREIASSRRVPCATFSVYRKPFAVPRNISNSDERAVQLLVLSRQLVELCQ